MVQQINDYNAVWFNGKGGLDECLINAEKSKHKFICAKDYQYIITENNEEKYSKPTKIYASYKNTREFIKHTKNVEQNEKNFYVIIPDKTPCCLFADLE